MDPNRESSKIADAQSLGLADEILASSDASMNLMKYTFTKSARLLLLKCVREHDAHLAAHGEKDKAFEKVHQRFMNDIPVQTLLRHHKPSVKTLRDKFRTMLAARKSKNRVNEAASGICEIVTEEDQLLDNFLLEIEDAKLQRKQEAITDANSAKAGKKRNRDEDDGWSEWMEMMAREMESQKKMKADEIEIASAKFNSRKKSGRQKEKSVT
eukprot:IDg23242t1